VVLTPTAVAVGGGAGGGGPRARVDLDQTQPARPERVEPVGGTQLGDVDACERSRPHDGGAFRHGNRQPIHLERDGRSALFRRSAEVGFLEQTHGVPSILAIGCPARKSSEKWAMALGTGIGVSTTI